MKWEATTEVALDEATGARFEITMRLDDDRDEVYDWSVCIPLFTDKRLIAARGFAGREMTRSAARSRALRAFRDSLREHPQQRG